MSELRTFNIFDDGGVCVWTGMLSDNKITELCVVADRLSDESVEE